MLSCDDHMTSGDDDDDDEDLLDDDEPQLDTVMIQHNGAINRIRVCTGMMSLLRHCDGHSQANVPPVWLLQLQSNTEVCRGQEQG